ncbi:MAG: hypothetical protein M1815_002581 [Lichina confinis]|nr:MAG: hypothetical protein M1815_002581 [Lichina confinis]
MASISSPQAPSPLSTALAAEHDDRRPSFPSLYWPVPGRASSATYLHDYKDIWRFTLFWTLLVYGIVHLGAGLYAVAMQQRKSWRVTWMLPLVFLLVAGLEAAMAGSVIGLILAGLYLTGRFQMSTWIPLVWALINVLVIVLSSFSIQGAI